MLQAANYITTTDLHAGAERPREKPAAPRGRERREVLEPMLIPICFSNFWLIGKFRANSAIFPERAKSPRFSDFLRFHNENYRIFQKVIFET